jgi:hypothetical protein
MTKMAKAETNRDYPQICEAPLELLALESNCGPLTIWWTLQRFGRRIGAKRIVHDSRHSAKDGVYAICMAACLRRYGLRVRFFSDKDLQPQSAEKFCYRRAKSIGIEICPAVAIETILKQLNPDNLLIVLYNKNNGDAHYSPVTSFSDKYLEMPFEPSRRIRKEDFQGRWDNGEILRQSIIVSS